MKRRIGEWIVFVVSVSSFLLSLDGGPALRDLAFNADVLYAATLYQDLIVDGNPLRGWSLTPSPYFFPDLFLYFCLRPWITDGITSVYVSFLSQVLLLAFSLFYFLGSEEDSDEGRTFVKSASILVYSFFLILPSFFYGTFHVFGFVSHGGALSFSLISAGLWIRTNSRKPASDSERGTPFVSVSVGAKTETVSYFIKAVLFSLLQILLLVSDPLYFFFFSLPCVALSVRDFFSSKNRRRYAPSLFLGAVTLAGLFCYRVLIRSDFVFIPTGYYAGETSWNFWKPIEDTIRYQNRPDSGPLLLLTFVYLSLFPILFYPKKSADGATVRTVRKTTSSRRFEFLILAVALSSLGILGTGTVSGLFRGEGIAIRYLLPLLFFWVPLQILAWSEHRSFFENKLYLLYIPILLLITTSFLRGGIRFSLYEDPLTSCLDEKTKEYGFRKGMSDFWTSRRIRIFSKTGLRADNFLPDLHPEYWQNSWNWYTESSGGEYDFAVLPGLNRNDLIASFGDPKTKITCDKNDILIWDKTSAEKFSRFRERKTREIDLWHKLTGRKRTTP